MEQKSQTKNTILFVVLMALCFGVWYGLRTWVFPPPPLPPAPPEPVPVEVSQAAALLGASDGGMGQGLAQAAALAQAAGKGPAAKPEAKPAAPPPPAVARRPPTALDKLKAVLGQTDRNSKFHLYAVLDPRGASVRRVVLNKFQQADYLGRPATEKDGSPKPLELVPDDPENPSCLLLHFDVNKKDDDKPFDTLGKVDWNIDPDDPAKTREPAVVEETLQDGRVRQSVTFVSPPVQGFQVSKTFSLTQGEYHLGLEVKVKRLPGATLDDKPVGFRYQMTGFHGLPIEGRWYTNIFRNALIGQVEDKSSIYRGVVRDYQDLRQTASWEGGNPVDRQQGYIIRYAGVALQYFASVIVVDNEQEKQDFLVHARPTLERTVVKGVVKSVSPSDDPKADSTFVLTRADNGADMTFRIRTGDESKFLGLQEGMRAAVVYTSGSYDGKEYPEYARELQDEAETQPLWEDDVTVRVATEPVELAPGKEAVHKYLLYNGPSKVMLLEQADTAAEKAAPGLVSRYIDQLNLNTLTDYQSPSWIGNITGPVGVSWMLIQITNVMHWVLWFLHTYLFVPYILCIVLLTVMVRGTMFPVSRKQAMTSIRMQQLGPEMKKLQEKFKEDKQGLAAAQMELYRKHGVNPFGTCWLLLLQMPIFASLYYCLQESIHFRLASVSPWWMPNLAAPDMLLWWGSSIPIISQPSWYGWPIYLGPYLNVLPIIAVSLMLVQQKWTMPPPTDEQQEQQQKMMKYMMIFMGLMFYKVASGLCIYFVASSLWGFAERQLLPKKKPVTGAPPDEKPRGGVFARLLGPKPGNGSAAPGPGGRGKRGRRRQEAKTAGKGNSDGSMFQRLRDWWEDILEQARKK